MDLDVQDVLPTGERIQKKHELEANTSSNTWEHRRSRCLPLSINLYHSKGHSDGSGILLVSSIKTYLQRISGHLQEIKGISHNSNGEVEMIIGIGPAVINRALGLYRNRDILTHWVWAIRHPAMTYQITINNIRSHSM